MVVVKLLEFGSVGIGRLRLCNKVLLANWILGGNFNVFRWSFEKFSGRLQ